MIFSAASRPIPLADEICGRESGASYGGSLGCAPIEYPVRWTFLLRRFARDDILFSNDIFSVDAEVDFDVDGYGYGFAFVERGFEFVLTDGFDGFFVEAHAEGAGDVDLLGIALRVDDEGDEAEALIFGASGFVGEFGIGRVDKDGRRNAATDFHESAAVASAFAGADPVAAA